MLRGLLTENQTCCFCTMRAGISLARTERSEIADPTHSNQSGNRTRICHLGRGGSKSVKLRGRQNGGAPGTCTPDTLDGATVFRTASSTNPDVLQNGSPTWTRTTTIRLTGGHATFTSSGILPAPARWRKGTVAAGGRARLHLEPQPLEAARAVSLTPCGLC
jgi:hypothetical protein